METLTPACSDPNLACPAGNENIEREFIPWKPDRAEGTEVATEGMKSSDSSSIDASTSITIDPADNKKPSMHPFSYLIASDSQLYWFNGEFAEMGTKNIPPACSPTDSCGRCTGKHGYSTNLRLRKAWESLMTGKTDGMDYRTLVRHNFASTGNSSVGRDVGIQAAVRGGWDENLPVPNTLIMNGTRNQAHRPQS